MALSPPRSIDSDLEAFNEDVVAFYVTLREEDYLRAFEVLLALKQRARDARGRARMGASLPSALARGGGAGGGSAAAAAGAAVDVRSEMVSNCEAKLRGAVQQALEAQAALLAGGPAAQRSGLTAVVGTARLPPLCRVAVSMELGPQAAQLYADATCGELEHEIRELKSTLIALREMRHRLAHVSTATESVGEAPPHLTALTGILNAASQRMAILPDVVRAREGDTDEARAALQRLSERDAVAIKVQEAVGHYVQLEGTNIEWSVAKARDSAEPCEVMSSGAQASSLVEDAFFILKRAWSRAVSTLQPLAVCAVGNHLHTALSGPVAEELRGLATGASAVPGIEDIVDPLGLAGATAAGAGGGSLGAAAGGGDGGAGAGAGARCGTDGGPAPSSSKLASGSGGGIGPGTAGGSSGGNGSAAAQSSSGSAPSSGGASSLAAGFGGLFGMSGGVSGVSEALSRALDSATVQFDGMLRETEADAFESTTLQAATTAAGGGAGGSGHGAASGSGSGAVSGARAGGGAQRLPPGAPDSLVRRTLLGGTAGCNTLRIAAEYNAKLLEEVSASFAQLVDPAGPRGQQASAAAARAMMEPKLHELGALTETFEALLDASLRRLLQGALPPLRVRLVERLRRCTYELDSEAFERQEQADKDPFARPFAEELAKDHRIGLCRQGLLPASFDALVTLLAEEIASLLLTEWFGDRAVAFNEFGAMQMEKEIRVVMEAIEAVSPTSSGVRSCFGRLQHCSAILNLEHPSHLAGFIAAGGHSRAAVLTEAETRAVLRRRVDYPRSVVDTMPIQTAPQPAAPETKY
eukprot:g1780.t1